ncbi:MAG: hypothetical protein IIU08_04405 [Clostridia bacterium]|nr:hypothetical protein [Clostridia bacterium]
MRRNCASRESFVFARVSAGVIFMLKEGILPGDFVFSFIIAQTAEVFQRKEEKKGFFCDFFIVYLSCALALAGMNRPSRLFFSPARLADNEDSVSTS